MGWFFYTLLRTTHTHYTHDHQNRDGEKSYRESRYTFDTGHGKHFIHQRRLETQ
uniref:Uncharacterized protein n=1 Tax=Anopheles quadriannulatus TaxID=34691 RepID=A0A182XQK5_ANOQN